MKKSQNLHRRMCLVIVLIAAFGSGYGWRAWRTEATGARRAHNLDNPDSLVGIQSFSEIENAKALLNGLSFQFLAEMAMRRAIIGQPLQLSEAVADLRTGIKEFAGTEEELNLLRVELALLKEQRQYNRWLDIYLQALYEHPTSKLVGCLAEDAIAIGTATGRESEVMNALDHLVGIPLAFTAKEQVQRALTGGAPKPLFVRAGS
jgi:hypothetical protein